MLTTQKPQHHGNETAATAPCAGIHAPHRASVLQGEHMDAINTRHLMSTTQTGGKVLFTSNEWFAACSNMISVRAEQQRESNTHT